MIQFDDFYDIAPSEISCIQRRTNKGENFPFVLEVHIKNGKTFAVSYKSKDDRDRERVKLANAVARYEDFMRPSRLTAGEVAHEVAKVKACVEYRIKRELVGVMNRFNQLEKLIKGMEEKNDDTEMR